jgi:DNA-binding LytR/AlgR family response regulator
MKTIILEDEPLVAKDLQKLLIQIEPSVQIVTILDSLQSSIEYFKTHDAPDLLLMDIQLSDGVSFDLLKHVDVRCPIIFTTAYNEYAIRAFKVNSIDYLLKPIDKIELQAALEKFKKIKTAHGTDVYDQLQRALDHLTASTEKKIYKERFMVHSGKAFVVVHQTNVAYFIKDTLIYLVTNDKQQFLTDFQTMEELEDLLNPKLFYRANRQYIISAQAVDTFRTDIYSKMILQLKSPLNVSIDISREKHRHLKTGSNSAAGTIFFCDLCHFKTLMSSIHYG